MARQEIAFDNECLLAVFGVLQQPFMEVLQAEMRNRGVDVMGQVVILAHRENRELDQSVYEEHARVREPAAAAVAMLYQLPEQHEKRERGENRHDPEQEIIDCCPLSRQPGDP